MTKIIFFGTPLFAAHVLEYLISQNVSIAAIVTQPDRPKGRSLQMSFSPVKQVAGRIPVFQPEKCSNPEFLSQIEQIGADLFVVVAFGQILPVKLLAIPPLGCINVHASLLPKYRGAAPIQRCLINGEKETGIAIQKMVKGLDEGDVIAEAKIEIPEEMTFGELEAALCELSKPLLLSVIKAYSQGIPEAKAQDGSLATYASKISPEEGKVDWSKDSLTIHHLIRGFSPRPGAWCWVDWNGEQKRLKILRAKPVQRASSPNIIECGEGAIQILEVQMEGKPKMAAADWLRGARFPVKFS